MQKITSEGIPLAQQRLQNASTVHLVLRLRSGVQRFTLDIVTSEGIHPDPQRPWNRSTVH